MQSFDTSRDGNLPLGILAGLVAAVLAAIVWGAVTAATNFQIGYMAIGVGFLVAFAVRLAGRGHGQSFAIASGLIALLGCVLGDYLSTCAFIASDQHVSVVDAVVRLAPVFFKVIQDGFSVMSLVFYAIGAYFGYKYATVPLGQPLRPAPVLVHDNVVANVNPPAQPLEASEQQTEST